MLGFEYSKNFSSLMMLMPGFLLKDVRQIANCQSCKCRVIANFRGLRFVIWIRLTKSVNKAILSMLHIN